MMTPVVLKIDPLPDRLLQENDTSYFINLANRIPASSAIRALKRILRGFAILSAAPSIHARQPAPAFLYATNLRKLRG
jgi:hypothetical protein